MNSKEERLKNLNEESFYFIAFNGTKRPNNPHYSKITMFNDTFFYGDENGEKENKGDMYWILKVKEIIKKNITNIEKMTNSMDSAKKNSSTFKFMLKIDNNEYSVDRNICNEEGCKLYDEFMKEINEILSIK